MQNSARRNKQEAKNVDVALFEEFLAWKKERELRQQEDEAVQHTRKVHEQSHPSDIISYCS